MTIPVNFLRGENFTFIQKVIFSNFWPQMTFNQGRDPSRSFPITFLSNFANFQQFSIVRKLFQSNFIFSSQIPSQFVQYFQILDPKDLQARSDPQRREDWPSRSIPVNFPTWPTFLGSPNSILKVSVYGQFSNVTYFANFKFRNYFANFKLQQTFLQNQAISDCFLCWHSSPSGIQRSSDLKAPKFQALFGDGIFGLWGLRFRCLCPISEKFVVRFVFRFDLDNFQT